MRKHELKGIKKIQIARSAKYVSWQHPRMRVLKLL